MSTDIEQRLNAARTKLDKAIKAKAAAQGALNQVLKQMKEEFNVSKPDEAEKLLEKLNTQAETKRSRADTLCAKLEESLATI